MLTSASRIPICDSCFVLIEPISQPVCTCCGRPFQIAPQVQSAPELCRLCRSNFYAFERARSFAHYNDALAGAILLLKDEQVTGLGDCSPRDLPVGPRRCNGHLGRFGRASAVAPRPQRERGYNQAELIARALARRLHLKLEARLLVRTKPRPPRLVLPRSEHWKSVRGAYATREGARVDKLRILLVDDVLTTGATLDACSRALKKAGAAAFWGSP
jgi:predicted amidophosphoribosyltransferase